MKVVKGAEWLRHVRVPAELGVWTLYVLPPALLVPCSWPRVAWGPLPSQAALSGGYVPHPWTTLKPHSFKSEHPPDPMILYSYPKDLILALQTAQT